MFNRLYRRYLEWKLENDWLYRLASEQGKAKLRRSWGL